MTKIERPLLRETAALERGRPLLIELHPGFLVLRPKGTRQRWSISYDAVFWTAVKAAVKEQRAEKQQQKGASAKRGSSRKG